MSTLNIKHFFISALIVFAFSASINAQSLYKLNDKNSKLVITGTSSIHDWEMEAQKISCESTLQITDNLLAAIQKISFQLAVEEIKSDNQIMDSKTHKALKEKQFPEISFKLAPDANFAITENNASFSGLLNIAGETRTVKIVCQVSIPAENTVKVKGEIPLKMSDFNITPPTAMMGALKTGDEIVIKYDIELNQ